jgi:multidrug efflux pump
VNSALVRDREGLGERERTAREIAGAAAAKARKLPGVRVSPASRAASAARGFNRRCRRDRRARLRNSCRSGPRSSSSSRGRIRASNVDTNYKERKPQIRVSVDRDRAAELGVSLQTVGRTLETVLGSRIVTTYVDRGREYNVILQAPRRCARDEHRPHQHPRALDRTGELIPLSNVVRSRRRPARASWRASIACARSKISADLAPGYTMGEAVQVVPGHGRAELPPRDADVGRRVGEFTRTGQQLYFTFLFALAIVFLVLAAQFESFVHPMIIMVTVPLALLGAVFGLKLYGMTINIFSQIAVIMLIGIAAKNGVLIVEFANQLRDRGVEFTEAIVQAAVTRLRPVLMTSLCTAFGALPFLLATGRGRRAAPPIGIVVFFGTLVSVFLTLFAVPAVYSIFAPPARARRST